MPSFVVTIPAGRTPEERELVLAQVEAVRTRVRDLPREVAAAG